MRLEFCKLIKDFDGSDERMSLLRDLEQSIRKSPTLELADDQVIVNSAYSDATINDVFLAIYKKAPQKIIVASERSKIVCI